MKIKREIIAAAAFSVLIGVLSACSASAADKEFVVHAINQITGDNASALQLTYELQNIDGSIVSSKTSSEQDIAFDPIILDDADTTSHFYKIVQKNDAIDGVSYDGKTVYVRIVPNRNLVAYQDDTSYKTINDGSGPHPYHATEEELQGQAYAVYDSKTKTLTFFRDEEGKYVNGYAERIMDGEETQYKQYFTDFELVNKDHPKSYGAVLPTWSLGCRTDVYFYDPYYYSSCSTVSSETETIIFKDAIRPEGAMVSWFENFKNVVTADIGKLDTSRVTVMDRFFRYAEKLTDIDITTMDFRKATESAADGSVSVPLIHFLNHTPYALQELDFRNFDIVEIGDKFLLGEAFWGAGLRYLNTTNLSAGGASQDFNGNSCLERLVVGEKYSFYRSNLDMEKDNDTVLYGTAGWLKIETGEINSAFNMIIYDHGEYNGDPNPLAAGNYVRPTCNVTPVTFKSTYVKPAEPAANQDGIKNPDTNDLLGVSVLASSIGVTSIAVALVVLRRRR